MIQSNGKCHQQVIFVDCQRQFNGKLDHLKQSMTVAIYRDRCLQLPWCHFKQLPAELQWDIDHKQLRYVEVNLNVKLWALYTYTYGR